MDEKIIKLILAIGKLSSQQKQVSGIMPQMNQSESGIFLAMLQISAEKPETELFSLSELNCYLDYTRPNLSQTVNKLEDKDFVERVILKDDRRVTYIRLTDEGKEMLEHKYEEIIKRMGKIKEIIGEENIDIFLDLLVKFIDAYEKTE